jgi:hypothetical protein
MLAFKWSMIQRAGDNERDDVDAESERQHVISVIRIRADVQEEYEMHAHLRDREHRRPGRYAGRPE